jgi:general stress protein 26
MNQQELKDEILKVLENQKVGTLATVKNDRPHSRFMTFFHKDLTFYTPTNKKTHKAEEIAANPYVHILIGYDGEGYGDSYIEVEGKASIKSDKQTLEKFWDRGMERWFDGPEDPEFILLEIEPEQIRLMNAGQDTPEVLEI